MRSLSALPLVWLAACGLTTPRSATAPDVIDAETFASVYIELRRAQEQAGSPEAFATIKRELFERYGIEEEMLIRFAETHGRDIDFIIDLWNALEKRLAEEAENAPAP
jgi:hypothetical protein